MAANRTVPDADSNPSGIGGTAYADDVRDEIEALWNGVISQCATVAGTANAITATCSPVLIGTYVDGQTFRLVPASDNSSAVTLNIDSRGAKSVKDQDGNALSAGDIIAGRPIVVWFDALNDCFRLSNPSEADLLASLAASIAASSFWDKIGDTTVSTSVAKIEHTFNAGDYSRIIVVVAGLAGAANSVPRFSLSNASGAIFHNGTLGTHSASVVAALRAEYLIDLISATKRHYVHVRGVMGITGTPTLVESENFGSSATAPDRINLAYDSGNVASGRMITYGMKAS